MQKHRIFIAVNLSDSAKDRLYEQQYKWLELPCRWTKKENLHITLAFLGYLNDEDLPEVCKLTEEVVKRHDPFFINLTKITYGPPKSPRMVWVEGEKSKELGKLQKDLQNSLISLSSELESEEKREFSPHITLGRLKMWEFRQIEPTERPQINEDINIGFEVKSIEIMESSLSRKGPEYCVLESIPLKS